MSMHIYKTRASLAVLPATGRAGVKFLCSFARGRPAHWYFARRCGIVKENAGKEGEHQMNLGSFLVLLAVFVALAIAIVFHLQQRRLAKRLRRQLCFLPAALRRAQTARRQGLTPRKSKRPLPGPKGGGGAFWLGRRGSNSRMSESKSDALPLGYGPAEPAQGRGVCKGKDRAAFGCAVFGGVPRGIRTLGLQSHNLAR